MWTRFCLQRSSATKRAFSTFSRVNSNSIVLNNVSPTTIRIPISDESTMDYIINRDKTVADFQNEVANNCKGKIKQFEIDAQNDMKMDLLIKQRFNLKVNYRNYVVHPDFSSMLELKNRKKVEGLIDQHSLPTVTGAILGMFLDHLVTKLPNDPVSKEQLKSIITKAVKEYKPEKYTEMLVNIQEELKKTEEELEVLQAKHSTLAGKAQSYASKVILFGTSMASLQVGVFAYLIYGVYGWDDIEPVTYLTGAFYAWVSLLFYFRYKEDWEWSSVYSAFYIRRLKALMKSHQFDESRVEFLQRYQELLKLQLAYIKK